MKRIFLSSVALLAAINFGGCAGDGQGGTAGGGGEFTDFATIQQQIFSPSCATGGCHDAITQQAGLALSDTATSFQSLVQVMSMCAGKLLVDPGSTETSYLLDKLGVGAEPCNSVMPLAMPPLSDEQLAMIESWIAAGAPAPQ
jgi:hypothetical protein